MSDEYKKRLYDYFYKDTPIKYESITEQQWLDTSNTLSGISIRINQSLFEVTKELSKPLKEVIEALSNGLKK